MIKLFDNWIIEVDNLNYILSKVTGIRTHIKKDGTEVVENVTKPYGYFTGISGALSCLRDILVRQRLADGVYALDEALRAIKDEDERIKILLAGIEGERHG